MTLVEQLFERRRAGCAKHHQTVELRARFSRPTFHAFEDACRQHPEIGPDLARARAESRGPCVGESLGTVRLVVCGLDVWLHAGSIDLVELLGHRGEVLEVELLAPPAPLAVPSEDDARRAVVGWAPILTPAPPTRTVEDERADVVAWLRARVNPAVRPYAVGILDGEHVGASRR